MKNAILLAITFFSFACANTPSEKTAKGKETTTTASTPNNEETNESSQLNANVDSTGQEQLEESYIRFQKGNVLLAGEFMKPGDDMSLEGEEAEIHAKIKSDGLFFVYNSADRVWEAQPKAGANATLKMQHDGNLVLYDANEKAIWSTHTNALLGGEKYNTADWKPVKLVLEFNKLILISATGRQVWTSEDATTVKIETFTKWPKNIGDLSCSCTFSPRDNNDSYYLISNYNDKAVVQIDGQMVTLSGGSLGDVPKYKKRLQSKEWVVLNEKGNDYLFGEKIDYQGSKDWMMIVRDEFARTLFLMEKYPNRVPLRFTGTVGMGHRNTFQDLFEDAKKDADLQKKYSPEQFYFENDQYSCRIEASKIGQDDGGGPKLEGNIIIETKDGSRQSGELIKGGCGC